MIYWFLAFGVIVGFLYCGSRITKSDPVIQACALEIESYIHEVSRAQQIDEEEIIPFEIASIFIKWQPEKNKANYIRYAVIKSIKQKALYDDDVLKAADQMILLGHQIYLETPEIISIHNQRS